MQHFVGRADWLKRFEALKQAEAGAVMRITGQPGIGKSSLLRQFEWHCEHNKHPYVWLDFDGVEPQQGLDILTDLAPEKWSS